MFLIVLHRCKGVICLRQQVNDPGVVGMVVLGVLGEYRGSVVHPCSISDVDETIISDRRCLVNSIFCGLNGEESISRTLFITCQCPFSKLDVLVECGWEFCVVHAVHDYMG